MEGFLGILIFLLVGAIYFIPTIVAVNRECPNKVVIILINVFLGWVIVGWIISLIWALTDKVVLQNVIVEEKDINYNQLNKLNELLKNNIITNEEFEREKERILKKNNSYE